MSWVSMTYEVWGEMAGELEGLGRELSIRHMVTQGGVRVVHVVIEHGPGGGVDQDGGRQVLPSLLIVDICTPGQQDRLRSNH